MKSVALIVLEDLFAECTLTLHEYAYVLHVLELNILYSETYHMMCILTLVGTRKEM